MNEENSTPTEPAATASQTRRAFLQRLTLGSLAVSASTLAAAGAIATLAPTDAEAAGHIAKDHGRKIKVFRLKSRGTHACRACQLHHRHIMFLTKKVAKHNRAHKHCNCPIVPQWITRKAYHRLFKGAALEKGFADLRKH